ncbi:MAG: hypothetical protein AB7N70_13985 [Dehalococcoidia bacterium]
MRRLTVAKWAASEGISKQAGYNAVKRCGIPIVDGTIDAEAATVLYRSRTQARMNPGRPAEREVPAAAVDDEPEAQDGVSYTEARRRREVAEAKTSEIRLAELAGTLVLRENVNRTLFLASRVMRDQMLSIAPRLAATLATVNDPHLIELRIGEEVRVALAGFAQVLRSGGLPDVSDGQQGGAGHGL